MEAVHTQLVLLGGAMVLYANLPLRYRRGRRKKKRKARYGPFELILFIVGLGIVLAGLRPVIGV